MGVTIHYAGQLIEPGRLPSLLDFVKNYAESRKWEFRVIPESDPANPRGFVLLPHPNCEPVRFEFGARFRFESWVKTQFAGPQTHIEIIRLLRQIQPLVGRLGVRDEGEFWKSGSEQKLREHMDTINQVIADLASKNPKVRTQVREPDGRITDLIQ